MFRKSTTKDTPTNKKDAANPFAKGTYYDETKDEVPVQKSPERATAPSPEKAAAMAIATTAANGRKKRNTSATGGLFGQRERSFSVQTEIPDIADDIDTSYEYGSQHRMKFGDSYYPMVSVTRPGNNVAANKMCDCDNEDTGYSAGLAVDENRSTYWCSKEDTSEAIFTLDLRSVMTVFKTRIRWKFHASEFTVSVSNNRKHFHQIFEEKHGSGAEAISAPTFTARFVRIHMTNAGKKFQGKPILGIIDVTLVSGVYVTIQEGSLKGKEYYVEKPHRTLVSLEESEADYRKSILLAAESRKPTNQKVKDRYQVGTHWKLTNIKTLQDTSPPSVTVIRAGSNGSVFVQRMIGKCEEILIAKPLKELKPLPKKAQTAAKALK